MKTFLISPPFGNWLNRPYATSVCGSFTWQRRPGLLYHTIRSLRPTNEGWINQIGLRNRGLRSVHFNTNCIYSLVGLDDGDWERMLDYCPATITPEINVGCPNVHDYGIAPSTLQNYCRKFNLVIVKLPPIERVDEMAAMCVEQGVRCLHLCNTIPTERGGESGARLFRQTLPIIERLAHRYAGVTFIAGGGIYRPEQLQRYQRAGAQHFSLATIWFTPWRVAEIVAAA